MVAPAVAAAGIMAGASMLDAGLGFMGAQESAGQWGEYSREALGVMNMNRDAQVKLANEQMAMQREFAQNGLRWKVEDAKAAGLHPLAALGATTSGYSPVSVMLESPQVGPPPPSAIGSLAGVGQGLARAITAGMDKDQQLATKLSLQRSSLENEMLATQLANSKLELAQRAAPKPMPSMTQFFRNDATGNIEVAPSDAWSSATQGNLLYGVESYLANKLWPPAVSGYTRIPFRGAYVPDESMRVVFPDSGAGMNAIQKFK